MGSAVKTSLVSAGWSVPVLDAEKMTAAAGVCYATLEQGKKLVKELSNAKFPLAVVTSKEIDNDSTPLQVSVTNGEKIWEKDCFLTKIGISELVVSYTPPVQKVSAKGKTCVVVLQVWQSWMDQEKWSSFEKSPTASFVQWLSNICGVKHLDVFRTTMISGPDGSKGIRALARLSANATETSLAKSGMNSVFARPIFISDEDRTRHRIVWLKDGCLDEALRQAARMNMSLGLVANARGLGIRVPAESFEECASFVFGEDVAQKLTGDLWELTGVPMSWDQDNVAQVMLDLNWAANVVRPVRRGKTRTWIVRFAKDQQPSKNLLQCADEGALIRVQKATPPTRKAPSLSWNWKGKSSGAQSLGQSQVGTSRWSEGPPVVRMAQAAAKGGPPAQAAPTLVGSQAAPTQLDPHSQDSQPSNPLEAFAQCLAGIQAELAAMNERQQKADLRQHSTDNVVRSLKLALETEEPADWEDNHALDGEDTRGRPAAGGNTQDRTVRSRSPR